MKRQRVQVEATVHANAAALRRQRARHLLERLYMDGEGRRVSALRAGAAAAAEAKARAEWERNSVLGFKAGRAAAATATKSDPAAAAATAAAAAGLEGAAGVARAAELLAAVERTSSAAAAAAAAVEAAEAEAVLHHAKMRALADKQLRESSALVFSLSVKLKGEAASGGGGGGGGAAAAATAAAGGAAGGGGEEGGDEGAAPPATPAALAGAPAPAPAAKRRGFVASYTAGGLLACSYCGCRTDKDSAVECSECHRTFCGVGGRGVDHPTGLPCLDLYQCGCKLRVCDDCYTGARTRRPVHWRPCEMCGSPMCSKETAAKTAWCAHCGATPLCRSCRAPHDKVCAHRHAGAAATDSDSDSG